MVQQDKALKSKPDKPGPVPEDSLWKKKTNTGTQMKEKSSGKLPIVSITTV